MTPTIHTATFQELCDYYNNVLNKDRATFFTSNDEPTPIGCVCEMVEKIPEDVWKRVGLRILDPCCGNGNFHMVIYHKLLKYHSKEEILENMLYFNDTNNSRLENVRNVFTLTPSHHITNEDYLQFQPAQAFDLIVANPPYARFMENGKRASKNHNMVKLFIEKALSHLTPNGYMLFITPDNWTSYADRNKLIEEMTNLQIIHLDIHRSKKYFKKIGSSFTWFLVKNCPYYTNITVSGIWKKKEYTSLVSSMVRRFIPLYYTQVVQDILRKTIENPAIPKCKVETSSDLHKTTKASLLHTEQNDTFRYKIIHTPKQTVYSSRPHKFQNGYKVFISTTDRYQVFVDSCGMTQSIAFIRCRSEEEANRYANMLQHPLYVFLNNICRWGNFNNVRILQSFPDCSQCKKEDIYDFLQITKEEQECVEGNM